MKNIFIIFIMLFILSACKSSTCSTKIDQCSEKQNITDLMVKSIKEIDERNTEISEKDVAYLIKPLSGKFTLDEQMCQGFTDKVKDASKLVIRKRSNEIGPILKQICSREINPETHDVSLMAAELEERRGAKSALDMLQVSTYECLPN